MSKGKNVAPTPKRRAVILAQRRRSKMARSAHAYVRGSTVKFYEWLELKAGKALPAGPPVWICGDCHVGNLGPVANLDGKVRIQIRDLDQTVIGNPVHDIVRLGLSLATAARSSDLPGVTTARMIEEVIAGYCDALRDQRPKNPGDKVDAIQHVMELALSVGGGILPKSASKTYVPPSQEGTGSGTSPRLRIVSFKRFLPVKACGSWLPQCVVAMTMQD